MRLYEDFEEAQAAVGENEKLNGVLMLDGTPRYFVTKREVGDEAVRDMAFEARHGYPMTNYQRKILQTAQELQ